MDDPWAGAVAGAVLAVDVAAVVFTAWRVAGRCIGSIPSVADRLLAALVLALAEICAVLQLLGMLGVLSRIPVLVVHVALAAVAATVIPRAAVVRRGPLSPAAVVVVAAAAALATLGLGLGLQGRSEQVETRHYHASNAGTWLRDHDLWGLPFANVGFTTNTYPSNAELTSVWLMLPTGGEQLAYSANVLWGALCIGAVVAIAGRVGGSRSAGAVLALGLALTPAVFLTQFSSMLSDLAAAGGVLGGVALLLAARERDDPVPLLLVSGAALGLGIGAKYTALAPSLGAIVVAVLVLPRGRRVVGCLAMAATAAALSAFWFLRNAIETGNPLFPLELGPLRGADSPLTALDESMMDHLVRGDTDAVATWFDLVPTLLGPAVVVLPIAVLAAWRGPRHRRLVAALGLGSFAAYAITPYTGGGDSGLAFLMGSQFRYMLPALFLCAAVTPVAAGTVLAGALGLAMLTFDVIKLPSRPGFRTDLELAPGLVVATVAAFVLVALAARHVDRWWPTAQR